MGLVSFHESFGVHLYSMVIPVTPPLTASARD